MGTLTKWFIEHKVAANLLMVTIIISGLLALTQLRVESFPQVAPSSVVINVAYPGATATQIDESITQRIEQAISGIAGIKQVTSQSSAGLASVVVRKTSSTDLAKLLDDVRNRVDAINGFPLQAEKPQVTRNDFTNLAAFVIVAGPRSDSELQPIAHQVEQALTNHPAISNVTNWGRRSAQLLIEPDPDKMQQYGLSLAQLAQTIEQMSLLSRSGELQSASGRIVIRGDGYADDLQKLQRLSVISGPQGTVYLGDMAKLSRGYEDSGAIVRNNGQSAIALLVSTSQNDNLLKVSDAIEQTLAQQRKVLPSDIALTTMADMAPYIEDQLFRLGDNAWQGLLIVLLILGLFLQLRLAFWVAVGIPVALAGTLAALQLTTHSINDITLFGIILVLGILVDDAVVVGEAIHEQRVQANGQLRDSRKAAWLGVKSVSLATVFGVLTTIAAFSSMLWIDNEVAKVLSGFSLVVILALLFSLLESKFILPAHLANLPAREFDRGLIGCAQASAQGALSAFNQRIYQPVLAKAITYPVAFLLGFIAMVILAYGMWATGTIRSAVFPDIPGRYISAKVELEDGAAPPLQQRALAQLEQNMNQVASTLGQDYGLSQPPVINLLAWSDGLGEIEVTAELTSEALTLLPANLLLERWRSQTGVIEGAYAVQFSAAEAPAGDTFISIQATDRELAKQVSHELAQQLMTLPGVADVVDDGKAGQAEVRLILNQYGLQLGLSQAKLAQLAGEAFGERELYRLLEQGQETKVLLKYPKANRTSLSQLAQTWLQLDDGNSVLLGDVAEFALEQQPQVIHRRDRAQVINLYWRQNRDVQAPEQTLAQLSEPLAELALRYPQVQIKPGGEFAELAEVSEGFNSAMLLTLMLIFVLLAVPLQSYWQPLIIMAVIPFGFAGAIFGHYLMDLPISLLSMFGMMAMTGIVINDSLVLLTRFNQARSKGVAVEQAIMNAGSQRLRAIFLTTLTTVCGLLPLLCESAEQAQYLKPAAVSLVFGELFATVVTLVLIPVLLKLFSRERLPALSDEPVKSLTLESKGGAQDAEFN
ncbi:efflux RND transporter permease subunit [Motilimonas eburnea]|uniref:efflux RND transporter permease subunit n=1 Tax=Motilimonas eburnea TaxID=1737488 RepID=UPI001E2A76A9|nr:efflux RND transporter permease subunit [Motilimonas eburnea]MCE2571252.1 efflux RND transporter permease subunit [Motilimonas eburnea]